MSASRNIEVRPLTARSALLSMLLGSSPPWLPTRALVRAGSLFGVTEGTVRTALSRMQAAGEIEAEHDGYRLRGRLLERQARLSSGRRPQMRRWRGSWRMAVVSATSRSPQSREALRRAMAELRLGEHREGVWLRPDNLREDSNADSPAVVVVAEQCDWFAARPEVDPRELAASLWDLDLWASQARTLLQKIEGMVGPLQKGDEAVLADGFVWSAAVLRHLEVDPLLPEELAPEHWPADELRERYEEFDAAYRLRLGSWLREAVRP